MPMRTHTRTRRWVTALAAPLDPTSNVLLSASR